MASFLDSRNDLRNAAVKIGLGSGLHRNSRLGRGDLAFAFSGVRVGVPRPKRDRTNLDRFCMLHT
jgi:hypothetical protein